MEIEKLEIFPTLVMKFTSVLDNDQLELVFNFCKKIDTANHSAFIGNAKSSYWLTNDILGDIEKNILKCKNIKKYLQKFLDQYSYECGIEPTFIETSWFNIQNKKSSLLQHTHPNSTLSAALYINTDSKSSDIFFESPNPHASFNNYSVGSTISKYIQFYYNIHPNIGDLIIFPSWLKHGSASMINETNNRMVISFNTNK